MIKRIEMDKIKLIVIIIAGLVAAYFIIRMIIEPSYEILERSSISLPDYNYEDPSQKGISEEYQKSDFNFKEVYPTDNRFLLYHYDKDYWIIWTGVVDLDDGLKFIYTPRHSRLVVIDRKTNEVVSDKLFLRRVTNAKIVDGYIYFVYASLTGYKLGRYNLTD